jgi:hypothetical protein
MSTHKYPRLKRLDRGKVENEEQQRRNRLQGRIEFPR